MTLNFSSKIESLKRFSNLACIQSASKARKAYSPLTHADSIALQPESEVENRTNFSGKSCHSRLVREL